MNAFQPAAAAAADAGASAEVDPDSSSSPSVSPTIVPTEAPADGVSSVPDEGSLSGPTSTETPVDEGFEPYVIATAGDISCDPTNTFYNRGRGTSKWCRQRDTADLVARLRPDMVVPLGDNQYDEGKLSQYRGTYNRTWGKFKDITYPVIGNHEYWSGSPSGYFDYFGSRAGDLMRGWYSLDRAGWHVISLNSNCVYEVDCKPGSAQYEWLRQDLAASSATCQVAFMHHPRFSSGPHGDERSVIPLWQLLHDAGVELVLDGHDHIYERFAEQTPNGERDPEGIRQITVGTGGAEHYWVKKRHTNSVVHNSRTFGVLKLSLLPTSYEWRFVPVGRRSFSDTGTDTCH